MLKHRLSKIDTTAGRLWFVRCIADTGHYVFRYAYDNQPSDKLLQNLNSSKIEESTNLAANYIHASHLGSPVTVRRPTTAKDYWYVIAE